MSDDDEEDDDGGDVMVQDSVLLKQISKDINSNTVTGLLIVR